MVISAMEKCVTGKVIKHAEKSFLLCGLVWEGLTKGDVEQKPKEGNEGKGTMWTWEGAAC